MRRLFSICKGRTNWELTKQFSTLEIEMRKWNDRDLSGESKESRKVMIFIFSLNRIIFLYDLGEQCTWNERIFSSRVLNYISVGVKNLH